MILEDKILDFIETKSQIKDGDPPAKAADASAPAELEAPKNEGDASASNSPELEEKKEG
jgi:hypothetical protein